MNRVSNFFKLDVDYDKRIFGIDLMRCIAIISVVTVHASMLDNIDTGYPWIPIMSGVQVFFVLSGFLIGGVLIKSFQKDEPFGILTIRDFWIRRWFRTLPSYYLILILNIIFVYFGFIKEDFTQFNWKFFFFLQNFSQPFVGFFWESWSLAVQEWFYILFPILLLISYLIMRYMGVSKRYIFLVAAVAFLLIPIFLRFFIASKFEVDSFWLNNKINKIVIYRMDVIALGLLAAYIKYWHPKFWLRSRNISFILGVIVYYGISYIPYEPNDFYAKVFRVFFQSIGCVLLLPKCTTIKTAPALLTKVVTHISLISYQMYLINLSLVASVIINIFPFNGTKQAWILFCLYWILTLVFSTILYKYYENPITSLRDNHKIFQKLRI